MLGSESRILTTHTGSLPRTPELVDMFVALSQRQPVDPTAFSLAAAASTRAVIRKQSEASIDIVNNGEQSRRRS